MATEPGGHEPGKRKPGPAGIFGSAMGEAGPYLGLGLQLALSMVVFLGLGYFADRWLGTAPWLLIAGAVLGMVASGFYLYRVVQELDEKGRASRPPREARKKP